MPTPVIREMSTFKTFTINWRPNVDQIIGNAVVQSPEFLTTSNGVDLTWKLILSTKSHVNPQKCGFRFELIEINGVNRQSIRARFEADLSKNTNTNTVDTVMAPNVEMLHFIWEVNPGPRGAGYFIELGSELFTAIPNNVNVCPDNRLNISGKISIENEMFNDPVPEVDKVKNSTFYKRSRKLYEDYVSDGLKHCLADFSITTSDDKRFYCHRFLLSAQSNVFETMFENEAYAENVSGNVNLNDIDGESMKEVLCYFYTESLSNTSPEVALKCLYSADKYNLIRLKSECEKILQTAITIDNVCEFIVTAEQYNMKLLLRRALRFARLNYSTVKETDQWKSCSAQIYPLVLDAFNRAAHVICSLVE